MSAAVLFDKDGTLVHDVPYNVDPSLIELRPDAGAALRRLQAAGFALGIVSNQSGVARGYFAESNIAAVERRVRTLLADEGVRLDCFLYCPHHPDGSVARYAIACDCRKPRPGLVSVALGQLHADPRGSWFVGDILDDVEAGARAGCRTVLLDVGSETEWRLGAFRDPYVVAPDLTWAASAIIDAQRVAA
jgi:D-glycero-D-manno-heptose 1,7-bisphosphate phosphatase